MWSGIVTSVASLGQSWLKNSAEKSALEHEYSLTKLQSKIKINVSEAEATAKMKLNDADAQNSADILAIKEGAESYWDNFLVLLFLMPFIMVIFGACIGQDAKDWGNIIFETLNTVPDWYKIGLLLVFVRYLGFRRLLNKFLESKKVFKPSMPSVINVPTIQKETSSEQSDTREGKKLNHYMETRLCGTLLL